MGLVVGVRFILFAQAHLQLHQLVVAYEMGMQAKQFGTIAAACHWNSVVRAVRLPTSSTA